MKTSATGLLALSLLLFLGSLLYSMHRLSLLRQAEAGLRQLQEQRDLDLQQDIAGLRAELLALDRDEDHPLLSTRRTILQQTLALLEQQQLGRRYGDAIPYPEGWVRKLGDEEKREELQNLAEERRRLEAENAEPAFDESAGGRERRLLETARALSRARLELLRLRECALRYDLPLFARETPAMAAEWDRITEGLASEGHSLVDLHSFWVRENRTPLREAPGRSAPQAGLLDQGRRLWTSDSSATWIPVRITPHAEPVGFVDRRALSPEPQSVRPQVDILDMDYRIVTRSSSWWKVSWLVRVKNRGVAVHDLVATIRYLDEDGFVLDEHREHDLQLSPDGVRDFSGMHLVAAEVGRRIAGMRTAVQPAP